MVGQSPTAALRRFFPKTQRNPRSQVHWPTILSSDLAGRPPPPTAIRLRTAERHLASRFRNKTFLLVFA
jgi:hypothetical protein